MLLQRIEDWSLTSLEQRLVKHARLLLAGCWRNGVCIAGDSE